jgi:hypothetical protein
MYLDETEVNDLGDYLKLLKDYDNDHDIYHKVIYSIYRYLERTNSLKSQTEQIKKIAEEIKKKIYLFNSSVLINRECLRLLVLITMHSDNTLMWLKFDSSKLHVDYSNYSDVILKYRNPDIDLDPNLKDTELFKHNKILFPPYKKVKAYADKMGAIFYSDHVLVLPKRLYLGDKFTIWFRFFNPVPDTDRFHVLLQDPTGLGGLVVIHSNKKRLGCFTKDGVFIDSGIDLENQDNQRKWLQVAMSYGKRDDETKVQFYLDGKSLNNPLTKVNIPNVIQYIGNSRDYTEPFGIFCDLRIYKNECNTNEIKSIYNEDNIKKVEKSETDLLNFIFYQIIDNIMDNFLKSNDESEETFYFTIRLINNIMANRGNRSKFIKNELIMKILSFFKTKKKETKKEISKFILTIS